MGIHTRALSTISLLAGLLVAGASQAQEGLEGGPRISSYGESLEQRAGIRSPTPAPTPSAKPRLLNAHSPTPSRRTVVAAPNRRGLTNALEDRRTADTVYSTTTSTTPNHCPPSTPTTSIRRTRTGTVNAAREAARRNQDVNKGRQYMQWLEQELDRPGLSGDQRDVLSLTHHNLTHGLKDNRITLDRVGQLAGEIRTRNREQGLPEGPSLSDMLKGFDRPRDHRLPQGPPLELPEEMAKEFELLLDDLRTTSPPRGDGQWQDCARCHTPNPRLGSGFSEDDLDQLQTVIGIAEIGGGFVPVVGEVQDFLVLVDPNEKWWIRGIAVVSLGANCATAGFLPNFGGLVRGGGNIVDAAGDAGRGLDDVVEAGGRKLDVSTTQPPRSTDGPSGPPRGDDPPLGTPDPDDADDLAKTQETLADQLHVKELGTDPKKPKFNPGEGTTGSRLEDALGTKLDRSDDPAVDWIDPRNGKTYDAVLDGNYDPAKFDWDKWPDALRKHLDKDGLDNVIIDLVDLDAAGIEIVERILAGLSETDLAKIIIIRPN